MKILLINFMETTSPGGINKTVHELGKNLSKKGHSVTVLQPNVMDLPSEEFFNGFKIIRVKSRFKNHFYGFCPEIIPYFKNSIKDINPDVIHIHGYQSLLLPEILILVKSMKLKSPVLLTPHYDPLNRGTTMGNIFGNIYDRVFGKILLRSCDGVISISDFESNNIKKIQDSEITVIPHGVDNINIKKLEKHDNNIKLIYVGYLLGYKGVQYIVKALNVLVNFKKLENVKLTVVGDGKYKGELLKLSKRLNVEKYIKWKPFMAHDEVLKEMRKHDIFIILSKTEGYGLVVAEALSQGIPSIVTKKTALEEFIKEKGCFGVNCPPDPGEISDLILKIYKNDINVGPFTGKIRTWEKVSQDYEDVYKKALSGW